MSILSCQKTAEAVVIPEVSAKTMLNVSYGNNPKQQMDIYLPANRSNKTKAIVLIHGGGWNSGDKSNLNPAVDSVKNYFQVGPFLILITGLLPVQMFFLHRKMM